MINRRELLGKEYNFMFSRQLLEEIGDIADFVELKEGEEVIDYGQKADFLPLILTGALKVMRENSQGNEMLLYFLEKGDTCVSMLNCCMRKQKSEVRIISETDTVLALVPTETMERWFVEYKEWRTFLMQAYYERVNELISVIDGMAFQQLDERIFNYLKDKAMVLGTTQLHITHQEIASDLNSSRVVISRLLKKLELQGKIKIRRHQVEIIDF